MPTPLLANVLPERHVSNPSAYASMIAECPKDSGNGKFQVVKNDTRAVLADSDQEAYTEQYQ
jgi:hypothetical protein